MTDRKKLRCPEHDAFLGTKRVMYGLPIPGENYDDVVLGGCCVSPDSPKYGYECPVGKEVYYLDSDGSLRRDEEEWAEDG